MRDYQKDRQYSLIIGNGSSSALEINNLHITFSVRKSSDNKKRPSKARIEIYNLSPEHQKYVEEPFVEVSLSVGYLGIGMGILFQGQVTVAGTRKNGTDVITELEIDSLYKQLNHRLISRTLPAGTTVKSVIESVSKSIEGVNKVIFSGKNIEKSFLDGYPMNGSPREILNEISEAFEIEWQVDTGTLYIMDRGSSYSTDSSKAFVISEFSGMIERPYFDNIEKQRGPKDKIRKARKGVKLKILLNPAIIPGSIIKIEYGDMTGFYKVESLVHTGGYRDTNWETELVCGTML